MKFPVNKCSCGLDLTTVEPAEVKCVGEAEVGTCPQCLTPYFMVEDNALPLDPPPEPAPEPEPEPAPEPEPPVVKGGRRRVSEPEQPAEEVPPEEPGAEEKPSEKSEPEE